MRDNYRITEFQKCIKNSVIDSSDIKDVKKLPFLRESILGSLIREWKIAENQKEKDILECAGFDLAYYQEGVGVENLQYGGFNLPREAKDLSKFSEEEQRRFAEQLISKINSKEVDEEKKKYERFNKLCEKDQKIFYDKIGCALPFNHPLYNMK